MASKEKEKGNAAFKAGDFPIAIGHYTAAILADRTDPTFPLNRAAAYLKLGKNEDAERDCSTALALSNGNVKALFRRAQARVELGNVEGAQEDLRRAAALEPANQSVKQELERVAQLSQKQASTKAKPTVTATQDPAPKRRRVPITIVEPDGTRSLVVPEAADPPKAKPTLAPTPSSAAENDFMKPVSSRPLGPTTNGAATQTAPPKPASVPASSTSFKEAKTARDTSKPSLVGGGIFRASGEHTIFKAKSSTSPGKAESPETEKSTPSAATPPATYDGKTPTTLFEFTRAWEGTADPGVRLSLLLRFPPTSLPTLFQTSLDPALFVEIIDVLRVSSTKTTAKEYMHAFASVPRFGTVVRFLSASERQKVRGMWVDLGVGVDGDGLTRPGELEEVWGALYR
ncbi:TPR-like protein [Mycena amicta]|nr:TPR-like protein [Mycena amicta]